LVLVDSDEYEGGDFQICVANPNKNKIINIQLKNKGTMIFFPSFVWHRVMPVTKGTRYSLVCWNKGLKFN
jgi:PKHD-type hydroxylase